MKISLFPTPLSLCAIIAASVLSSCQSFESMQEWADKMSGVDTSYMANIGRPDWSKTTGMAVEHGHWDEPAGTVGSPKIVVNLRTQEATFYKGSTMIGKSPISTGREGHGTPPGTYKVIQKDPHYKSGTYGILRKNGTNEIVNNDFNARTMKVPAGCWYDAAEMPWFLRFTGGYGLHAGFLPGYAASHGCVRMLPDMAKKFFENAPLGTPVIVTQN